MCRRVFSVCRTNSLINLSGNSYNWSLSNDTSNDILVIKRNGVQMMSIDQNANMNIAMINSATLLGCTWSSNTIDVAHGGTGITSTNPNGIICANTSSTGTLKCTTAGTWSQFLMSQ